MHEVVIMPSRGVAIFIQPNLVQLGSYHFGSMLAHAHNLYWRQRNILKLL